MKFVLLFFLFIGTIASTVKGQQLFTVEEAVAAALKNNYDILLLRNDSAVYALNNSYAYAGYLPQLNASGSYVINDNNQKLRLTNGTIQKLENARSDFANASVDLEWTVFDGLKMFATKDKLKEITVMGNLAIRSQLSLTIADVINTYYNIVKQKQQLKAIEEQMGLNEERVRQAEKKFSTGLGAKPELLQARVDLNAQKAARLQQLALIDQQKDRLNLLISFAPGTDYEVGDSIPINKFITIADVQASAATQNPAIMLAKQNINIAQLTLKERKAERWPTIDLNSSYLYSRTKNELVANSFSPLQNRNLGFNYGISIDIPIFNYFNVQRQIKTARLDLDYQQLLYDYQQLQTYIAINFAFKDYMLQINTLHLEEENILSAKENVFISSERLRLGVTSYLELRETQKSLEDAYNRLIAARYNAKVAETVLLRLKGDLVK